MGNPDGGEGGNEGITPRGYSLICENPSFHSQGTIATTVEDPMETYRIYEHNQDRQNDVDSQWH